MPDFGTEVNGDSRSIRRAGTRDFCRALAALVGRIKIQFLPAFENDFRFME